MTRNYGLQSKRGGLGGMSTAAPAYREGNPREYVNRYFPADSILAEPLSPPLERSDLFDPTGDIIASIRLVGLMLLLGAVIGAFAFWLMIVV